MEILQIIFIWVYIILWSLMCPLVTFAQSRFDTFINGNKVTDDKGGIRISEHDTITLKLVKENNVKVGSIKIEILWKESCIYGWEETVDERQDKPENDSGEKFTYGKNERKIIFETNEDKSISINGFEFTLNDIVLFHEKCKGSKFKIMATYRSSSNKENTNITAFYLKQ